MSRRKDHDWLYVPDDEIEEALYLGAGMVEGDGRLVVPRPLPPGVTEANFERWRTTQAKFRWCLRLVSSVLGDMAGRTKPEIKDLMTVLGKGAAPKDRVYLYVCAEDAEQVRGQEGVAWDRRKRMYYATRAADLQALFKYLTPAAAHAWQGEQSAQRATGYLMQEMAREEVSRRSGGGSGGIQSSKENAARGSAKRGAAQGQDGGREEGRNEDRDSRE